MYVVFLIYCSLSNCLQIVSYPYFITDCLFIFREVELFSLSLFRLVIVWYWHWWQGLWKLYGIKDFNIMKTLLKEKIYIGIYIYIYIYISLYRDIYCYRDIKFVISWYKILVISPTPTSIPTSIAYHQWFPSNSIRGWPPLHFRRWPEIRPLCTEKHASLQITNKND